jgi:hypothetical protein
MAMVGFDDTGAWSRCDLTITSTGRSTGSCLLPNGTVGERRAGPVSGEWGLLRHRRETERPGYLLGPVSSRQARDHRAGLRVRRQAPLRRLVRGRKARVEPPGAATSYSPLGRFCLAAQQILDEPLSRGLGWMHRHRRGFGCEQNGSLAVLFFLGCPGFNLALLKLTPALVPTHRRGGTSGGCRRPLCQRCPQETSAPGTAPE